MAENEPVLIKAAPSAQSEGATFTLQYKNRFLYSKYNPQKNILQAIENLNLLPGTLVLAFSPGLFYGLPELNEKCKSNDSELLCVEAEKNLYDFEKNLIEEKKIEAPLLPYEKNTAAGLDEFISNAKQKYRRVIRFDLSAGVSFNEDFYKKFYENAQNIVAAFWKNRLTLVRLGRLYSKNLFKNLLPSANSTPFESFEKSVSKAILVCGAGESLDAVTLRKNAKLINEKFYVLAVDAAIPALNSAHIKIDAVAATESQLAIEKAYIGFKNVSDTKTLFLFDLTSRAQIARRFPEQRAFYFSQFDNNNFLERLHKNNLLPKIVPPLGSIGLTASYLALLLRKDKNVPVYVIGLDFSFSAGKTHARGTAQSKALYIKSNRILPFTNFAAAFGMASQKVLDKNKRTVWTSKNLFGYAALFYQYFMGAKNLFDLGKTGLDLGLEKKALEDILKEAKPSAPSCNDFVSSKEEENDKETRIDNCRNFLKKELNELRALADLLSNGEKSSNRDKTISLDEQILKSLKDKEYLFLHFPDGTNASLELSFLTRVRSQIDFFAKDIETAILAARF